MLRQRTQQQQTQQQRKAQQANQELLLRDQKPPCAAFLFQGTDMFNPYFLLAALLSMLASFGGVYWLGGHLCEAAHDAEQLKVMQEIHVAAEKQAEEQAEEDQKTAQRYEDVRETVRTVYVKVKEKANENIQKNHGYADCSLDADGLRLYNSRPKDAEQDSIASAHGAVSRPP